MSCLFALSLITFKLVLFVYTLKPIELVNFGRYYAPFMNTS